MSNGTGCSHRLKATRTEKPLIYGRTHITEGLNTGATVADMQAQAGHVNAATTLRYAQATDAVQRRHRINFRFA